MCHPGTNERTYNSNDARSRHYSAWIVKLIESLKWCSSYHKLVVGTIREVGTSIRLGVEETVMGQWPQDHLFFVRSITHSRYQPATSPTFSFEVLMYIKSQPSPRMGVY